MHILYAMSNISLNTALISYPSLPNIQPKEEKLDNMSNLDNMSRVCPGRYIVYIKRYTFTGHILSTGVTRYTLCPDMQRYCPDMQRYGQNVKHYANFT